jgi:hypothetical protein
MADPKVKLAYDESLRAITAQAAVLDNLRSRAATIVSVASLVTTFLGGQALIKPTAQSPEVDINFWGVIAIGCFCGIGLCILAILWPYRWRFVMSAQILLAGAGTSGVTEDSMLSDVARYNEANYDQNEQRLQNLFWLFRVAVLLLVLESLAWIMNLR